MMRRRCGYTCFPMPPVSTNTTRMIGRRAKYRVSRNGDYCSVFPVLLPRDRSPVVQDVLGLVRSQARRADRESSEGASEGPREAVRDAAPSGGLGSLPRASPTMEKRFSSMANLAEAEDGGVDPSGGSSGGSVRDMSSVSFGASACNPRCVGTSAEVLVDGTAVSSYEAGGPPGEGRQPPRMREGGEAVSVGCSSSAERDQPPDFPALRPVGAEKHKAQRQQHASSAGGGPPRKFFAGSSVIDTEVAAATRIQATCRRRAAQNAVGNQRNKSRATRERKVRSPPVRGGGGRGTTTPKRTTTQQQRGEGSEEERTASTGQKKTQRQAAEIRRERAEREQCLQDQQFLFGPGFQQRSSLTNKRDSGGAKSSSGSEGQLSRCRDVASLTPSEEERSQTTRKSSAATKIQSHVRRKAASRRAAAARQGWTGTPKFEKNAAGAAAAASMPRLPIDSLINRQASSFRRAAPRVQREPLAILRQLRRDDSKALLKPRTDQFRLRLTIKSAIEAHIRKTGAARRKPRPLPTPPPWRGRHNMASTKTKPSQEQAVAMRARLVKPRAVSPLHRTVRKVNTLIATHKLREQAAERPGPRRARSAPTRATDRLRCAIFAAETMVEREFSRAEERRQSFGGTSAPADEFSGGLVGSPLLVPHQPMA